MAAVIANALPPQFAAGDTLLFEVQLSDYPASTWTLSFAFQKRSPAFDTIVFAATADGNNHSFTVTPAVTQLWTDGDYEGIAYVTSNSGERHQVWGGLWTITPNFALGQQTDTRTRARRILDFIDASFEKLASKQTVRATIEGVDLQFRNLDELTKARNYWAIIVQAEDARKSGKTGRAILARFSNPQPNPFAPAPLLNQPFPL